MAIVKADMPVDPTADNGDWASAIRQRRKALLQRFGTAAASALIFSPLLGWSLSFIWVVGYFLVQLLDLWIFAPIISGRAERLRGARQAAGWILLVLNGGYFGSLSVPLWLTAAARGACLFGCGPTPARTHARTPRTPRTPVTPRHARHAPTHPRTHRRPEASLAQLWAGWPVCRRQAGREHQRR